MDPPSRWWSWHGACLDPDLGLSLSVFPQVRVAFVRWAILALRLCFRGLFRFSDVMPWGIDYAVVAFRSHWSGVSVSSRDFHRFPWCGYSLIRFSRGPAWQGWVPCVGSDFRWIVTKLTFKIYHSTAPLRGMLAILAGSKPYFNVN